MQINSELLTKMAKSLFEEERKINRLDGWFLAKEIEMNNEDRFNGLDEEMKKAYLLVEVCKNIPLSVSSNAIFVGTQRDAFARTYALINPSFTVQGFSGYCDPLAIYNDIEPNKEFTKERIDKVRNWTANSEFAKKLAKTYNDVENYTKEVLFFVEQVTGHVIPDFKSALKFGVDHLINEAKKKKSNFYKAAEIALSCVKILCERYIEILEKQRHESSLERQEQIKLMITTLKKISHNGADNLHEAIQLYILLWTIMCLEQAPNPYAFSIGNADRIFEPYRKDLTRVEASSLFKHLLVFYNVGDRSWAISQNVIVSGRDEDGNDLTNEMTYAILDAYYDMNLPQPILSAKLHKNTPKKLYEELGKFFFTPGCLTPSIFNDDSVFEVLKNNNFSLEDIPNYSIAGCQEPLIMGKDNGNTTNSWLSLPKVLEVVLTGGYSLITNEKLIDIKQTNFKDIRRDFYQALDLVLDKMAEAANGASCALFNLRVPFLSCFMGGLEYGADMRDTKTQGTKYNGSGCLIHGLTVLADSFIAIDHYLEKYPAKESLLVDALKANFEGYDEIKEFLLSTPKFGNNIDEVDKEAVEIANKVSDMVASKRNYLNNQFRVDFSTPSTHLTYGYWVGATPNGRKSREMLNYGVDPLYGEATNGMGFRTLSGLKLPYEKFNGGYASHLGINPKYFTGKTFEEKGDQFYENIIKPLFFNEYKKGISPFYLYVNVTTAETLRKVLAEPKKYAPSGVYIMRIHGTFVNFLDLSPEIQQDIITRLDPNSTCLAS